MIKRILMSVVVVSGLYGQQSLPVVSARTINRLQSLQKAIIKVQVKKANLTTKGYELDRQQAALLKEYTDEAAAAKLISGCNDCVLGDNLMFVKVPSTSTPTPTPEKK